MAGFRRRRGEGVCIGSNTRFTVLNVADQQVEIEFNQLPEGVPITVSRRNYVYELAAAGTPRVSLRKGGAIRIGDFFYIAVDKVHREVVDLSVQAPATIPIHKTERRPEITLDRTKDFPPRSEVLWFGAHGETLLLFRGRVEGWRESRELFGWVATVKAGSMSHISDPDLRASEMSADHWTPCPPGTEPDHLDAFGLFSTVKEAMQGARDYRVAFATFREIPPENSDRSERPVSIDGRGGWRMKKS
jgi:sRNA-binding carbon storage regulator CsrA